MKWRKRAACSAESDADYRVSWSGQLGAWVYTAWAPGKWYAWKHKPIGYFSGNGAKEQAMKACKEHWRQKGARHVAATS